VDYNRIAHGHSAGGHGTLAFLLFEIGQPELADGRHIGFKTLADKLALHAQAGIVNTRWNVTYQIRVRRFLSFLARFGGFWRCIPVIHGSSIQMQYPIVKFYNA
jgi:hypothetical protein